MDRELEKALLQELAGLKENGLFFLDDAVQSSPVTRYLSEERFDRERDRIFRSLPIIAAHAGELPENGSFLTLRAGGLPVLLTRDRDGAVNAFVNVCRHRGARLVDEEKGCKHSFSCPYHAWTWNSSGQLRGVPHEKPGFPDLDRDAFALRRLPAVERLGLVWIIADPDTASDFDGFLDPIAGDLIWAGLDTLGIAARDAFTLSANWKLLVEGGLEAYHFKVAHKETIGPHFVDNLSSYQMLGSHIRSILPRTSIASLRTNDIPGRRIRDHANVLYSVFPANEFLLMQDHVAWVKLHPLSTGRTEVEIVTLAPAPDITESKAAHWHRNHEITKRTLAEDFAVNEAVQSGLESGANAVLTFGRYEGALHRFHEEVEKFLV
ncbi:aromatic ring-hydroxylating dioxygenase subunit alpha [Roseibium sp. MMSF_3412]|uniref:aromatic ring-hydroxylating oxygenase subunit alpha n=1 Tax=Roseibium sp. MMSF_3412 TaxID=3046712 RepID=UPI00274025AC|nr:SRPBCC family protein [Roseibium sp. MMSF_3412]